MTDSLQTVINVHAVPVAQGYKEFTALQVIEGLPPGATPAQQDSAVQSRLPQREQMRSTRPDTLNLPGYHVPSHKVVADTIQPAYRQGFFADSPWLYPEIPFSTYGRYVPLRPYRLITDDVVAGTLLCCMLLIIGLLSHSKRHVKIRLQEFFLGRSWQFTPESDNTGHEKRRILFFHMLLGVFVAFCYFDYINQGYPLLGHKVSVHALLAVFVGIIWTFQLCKLLLVRFVNWIFFDIKARERFNRNIAFLMSMESVVFFLLLLWDVVFDLPSQQLRLYFIILFGLLKFLQLIKTFFIFSLKLQGLLHLFVYFCALEIMPYFGLWCILEQANKFLS